MSVLGKIALRDAALIAVTVAGWLLWAPLSNGMLLSEPLGLVLGLAVAACAFVAHEWGHALAGMLVGSTLHAPGTAVSPMLFSFDVRVNTRWQFAAMSLGGFAVTAVAVVVVYAYLPDELFATRVARGGVGLLALITLFVEVPLLIIGLLSARLPRAVAVFKPKTQP